MPNLPHSKKITLLIPCYNEQDGIADVISGVPVERLALMGYATEIIVIDNNSKDKTAEICEALGVRVISEKRKGKGNAIRTGFRAVTSDTDFVVMLDGDNTYKASEIPRLIEPLDSGFCDVIVGSRLGGKTNEYSLRFRNRIVNWGFTFLTRQFYRANVTDVLSGAFAWKKDVIDDLNKHLTSEGFSIEMEMITKTLKLGYEMYSVPITYDVRKGETKINAIKDGLVILYTFAKNFFWSPKKIENKAAYVPNEA